MNAIRKTKLSHLVAVALAGGIGIGGLALLIKHEETTHPNVPNCIKYALDVMQQEPDVIKQLGGSYKVGRPRVEDKKFDPTEGIVCAQVPIYGAETDAVLRAYARRKEMHTKYKIFKLEMSFDNVAGKKLVLLDYGDQAVVESGYDSLGRANDTKAPEPEPKPKPHPKPHPKQIDSKALARLLLETDIERDGKKLDLSKVMKE